MCIGVEIVVCDNELSSWFVFNLSHHIKFRKPCSVMCNVKATHIQIMHGTEVLLVDSLGRYHRHQDIDQFQHPFPSVPGRSTHKAFLVRWGWCYWGWVFDVIWCSCAETWKVSVNSMDLQAHIGGKDPLEDQERGKGLYVKDKKKFIVT